MHGAIRAVHEIAGHTIVIFALLISFKAVEWLYDMMWGSNVLVFNLIPFKWLIQGADVAIFVSFVYVGIRSVLRAYKGQ